MVLLDGWASARLRVSGRYRTRDSAGFASAGEAVHGLTLHEEAGRSELTKPH